MKSDNISWIVFLPLLLALTSAQDPCQPWPQQLKTREECCDLPKYHPTDTETACYNQCGQLEDDLTTLRTCMENCFAANSTVVAKDKKINSNEAMKIPFLFPAGISAAWNSAIADALKKCQLNSTGHLSLDLAHFQYCVREYLKQHCVAFMPNTTGCDLVDEQFRKCMKIEPNCTALWPSGYHKCCDVPEMFKFRDKLVDDCEDKCRNSEYFNIMVRKCFFDCIVNDTKFVVNEKIDYEVVRKMLSFNVSAVWIIPITTVVNKCQRAVAGLFVSLQISLFFAHNIIILQLPSQQLRPLTCSSD